MPQSLSRVLIHLVFSTKDRQPFITPELRQELIPYSFAVLRDKGNLPIEINAVEDHIHLLFALSRTTAIAEVVEKLKSGSSKWAKTKGPGLSAFAWQAGYGSFSVGQRDVDIEIAYIRNQQEHHRKVGFKDEFRELMKLNRIDIDEKYVWD